MILDPESHQIQEVFAHYGLAMYLAQSLEKSISILLSSAYAPAPDQMTKFRYDDLLQENFSKTFGSILKALRDRRVELPDAIEQKLKLALKQRNWLAHDYWWERAVEFNTFEGREQMLVELQECASLFEELDAFFQQTVLDYLSLKGRNAAWIDTEMANLLLQGSTSVTQPVRKLDKKETLINVYIYSCHFGNEVVETPLFELSDHTFWTLCEVGLTHGPSHVDVSSLRTIPDFHKALPAEITPRPKGAANWNYKIELSTGYYIWVLPSDRGFRWGLRRSK